MMPPTPDNTVNNIMAWSTAVVAIAAVINLVVSVLLWRATKIAAQATSAYANTTLRMFESSHRPYVTVASIVSVNTPEQKILMFRSTIQNVGTMPAHRLIWTAIGKVNGNRLPQLTFGNTPTTVLFPNVMSWLDGNVSASTYDAIMNGTALLEIDIDVTYYGPIDEQAYTYQERRRYYQQSNTFVVNSAKAT